ncbi:MAG: hypothetical protein R3F16_05845 [Myxococcota bacterium]
MIKALQRLESGTKRVSEKLEADKHAHGGTSEPSLIRYQDLPRPVRSGSSRFPWQHQTLKSAAITAFSDEDANRLQLLESALQDDPYSGR